MSIKIKQENKDNIRDNCGVFGACNCNSSDSGCNANCIPEVFEGIHYLQHRGQQYCGIASLKNKNNNEIKVVSHRGRVDDKFNKHDIDELAAWCSIGHVSLRERQPMQYTSKAGNFALAFSGSIVGFEDIFEKKISLGHSFSTKTEVELLSKIIAEQKDSVKGLEKLVLDVEGAYSLAMLTKEGIYVARDRHGFRPLVLGKSNHGFYVASESRPFNNLDICLERDVEPGEIILIDSSGFKIIKQFSSERKAFCAFEWAYIASIDSFIQGISVQKARNNMGAKLAGNDRIDADIVAPVPMSGIAHAQGYHEASGIPYKDVYLYDRYSDRSYTPLTQEARDRIAKRKLSVLHEAVKGRRVVLCDDSIVRGTQMRAKVAELRDAGAREIHVRISSPPLISPCSYGISTRGYEELIAVRRSVEEIRKFIGATTLKYNSIKDFVEAIGMPEKDLCLKCWTDKPVF